MDSSPSLPFAGIRVLDLSQGFAGPYCASILAMQGAAVTKVEPPKGDWIREIGAGQQGVTAWTVVANVGKRSVCIDAGRAEGRALLQRLAGGVDVIVQSFRPHVIERLGLDYSTLSAANPGLVFVSITGFGPASTRAGSDSVFQAFTGIAHANRDDLTPRRIPVLLPDTATGLYAAQAVASALFGRSRDGLGRHLQISLLESCAALQSASILDDALAGGEDRAPATVPSGVFRARDGYLTVTSMSDQMFKRLLQTLGLEEWIENPRCATIAQRRIHFVAINQAVSEKLLQRDVADWIGALTRADVLCSEVLDYTRFRAMPETIASEAIARVQQSPYGAVPVARLPGAGRDWPVPASPRCGQHTRDVLAEAGIAPEEFARLASAGVVRQESADGAAAVQAQRSFG